MMISVYTDDRHCILSVCNDDLSGCSDWQRADIDLTPDDILTDDHGAALYRLENGAVVIRDEEERRADWPEEEPQEPSYQEQLEELADAARILFGEDE